MRQPAPDGFTGRGGISVTGGTVYRVAAGFERTAGSPTGRDIFRPRRGRLHDGSGNPPGRYSRGRPQPRSVRRLHRDRLRG